MFEVRDKPQMVENALLVGVDLENVEGLRRLLGERPALLRQLPLEVGLLLFTALGLRRHREDVDEVEKVEGPRKGPKLSRPRKGPELGWPR